MDQATLKQFFDERYGVYDIDQIALAPWNYKEEDEAKAEKLRTKLAKRDQVVNVNIRHIPDGETHESDLPYEVIDGNHRLVALRELGYEAVIAHDWGELDRASAINLGFELNEGDFEPDMIKVSANMQELLQNWSAEELAETLPWDEAQIADISKLREFDWSQFEDDGEDGDGAGEDEGESWEQWTFAIPPGAEEVIDGEINRIIEIMGLDEDMPLETARGLALEKMAANSQQVPTESLE